MFNDFNVNIVLTIFLRLGNLCCIGLGLFFALFFFMIFEGFTKTIDEVLRTLAFTREGFHKLWGNLSLLLLKLIDVFRLNGSHFCLGCFNGSTSLNCWNVQHSHVDVFGKVTLKNFTSAFRLINFAKIPRCCNRSIYPSLSTSIELWSNSDVKMFTSTQSRTYSRSHSRTLSLIKPAIFLLSYWWISYYWFFDIIILLLILVKQVLIENIWISHNTYLIDFLTAGYFYSISRLSNAASQWSKLASTHAWMIYSLGHIFSSSFWS